ncbi:MAG: hypothetical protein O3C61_06330 [Proteobacteria bacterium]|nr:hypothetical protein [Pseudomonadota bacterium]
MALTVFLLFKNIAKDSEENISQLNKEINKASNQLQKKEEFFAEEIKLKLKLNNRKYVNSESILIENYLNEKMIIVRVNYDQKSN